MTADPFTLDQAVIDAGRRLIDALTADPPDEGAVDAAREALNAAREARWGSA